MTEVLEAADALEAALREYVSTGFTGLAFHAVTNARARLRTAVAAAKSA